MFCGSCGKANPEGASFCAFCGKKLTIVQEEERSDLRAHAASPDDEAPKQPPEKDSDQHAAFRRPASADPARLVKPLAGNPAQPGRANRSSPEVGAAREEGQPPLRHRPQAGNVVAADGRTRQIPARRAPVRPAALRMPADTLVPQRRKERRKADMFFEDIELPDENPYEEEEGEEAFLSRRMKSAVAGMVLLAVLALAFWLLVLPGGQAFRAGLGMDAPASAYAQMGDRYLNEGSVGRAADAYYTALARDPDNYDYALKVARTQALAGNQDKALKAYALCLSLKESDPEPYRAVAELYQQMGQRDHALNALKTGYDKTGNVDLFRAYEALRDRAQ